MEAVRVPLALRGRLGDAAASALENTLEDAARTWRDDVLSVAAERFDRRLTEETARLRVEFAVLRADMIKWSFLFWIGQVAAMAGIMALLLRTMR
jgi:hypothetical protein